MTAPALLERILWKQLLGVLPEAGEFVLESESAGAIRAVLEEPALAPEESACVAEFDPRRELGQRLYDRLLQLRVNRALAAGLRVEARRLGRAVPSTPRVLVVREGGLEDPARSVAGRAGTVVELFPDSRPAVGATAPGERLEELVDLLVLADGAGASALRETLGPTASIARADDAGQVDLLLAGPTPSIQVLDIERELARLEELLRNAIPPEQRPAKSHSWSFGQDLTGELLGGKYRIKRLKGKGAFKTVYEAEDEMLGARVAVAVLNPKGARSPRALEHFQDEARKLTTLDHDHIVRWITFDKTPEGLHYFVMEYLDGEELEVVLRREGRLAPARVAAILLQIVAALRRAHAPGKNGSLLHLDLKPENVFLLPALAPGEPERVKVIDFGIGQHVGAEVRMAEHPELRSIFDLPAESLGLSIGSLALAEEAEPAVVEAGVEPDGTERRVQRARGGTLLYASPEQCRHLAGHREIEPLDGRSDLYSLGVMAFRMLTGQYPFARIASAYEAIQNHLEVAPRRVGALGVRLPRELAAFVDRCLVKDRARRWRDAGEALEALERIVHPRLSPLRVALPAAGVAVLGASAFLATRAPSLHALTLVDPALGGVSARGVEELFFGPESAHRRVRLESEAAWSAEQPPTLRLLDATSGEALAGWSVHFEEGADDLVTVALDSAVHSAVAKIELVAPGTGLARGERWLSERFALRRLGPWNVARVAVDRAEPGKAVDPRGLALLLELDGDPEGRSGLASIEVTSENGFAAEVQAGEPWNDGSLTRYRGPALDGLFAADPRRVELLVRARDLAGQERKTPLALELAGELPDFGARTGFVASLERDAAQLPGGADTLLLPGNALRIETPAAVRVRVFVAPSNEPRLVLERLAAHEPRIVALSEIGLGGVADAAGRVRLELDDAPFVTRTVPAVRTLELPYRYTPSAPEIAAELAAGDDGLALLEGLTNHVPLGPAVRLLVRTPPGANLWLEAQCLRNEAEDAPRRLARSGGAHALELDLEEGACRLVLRQYVLLAGDVRGPLIPPEHAFELVVDRSAPVLSLRNLDAAGELDGLPLHIGASGATLVAESADRDVAHWSWQLQLPTGEVQSGELEPGAAPGLAFLGSMQAAEGRYALTLEGADPAGNRGRARHAWNVAHNGPELALVEPAASGGERRWALGSGRAFVVRAQAADANGVTDVRVRLLRNGRPERELVLEPAGESLWEAPAADRPSAHPWWTGEELAFELVAHDGAGLETRLVTLGSVPVLPRDRALVIVPRDHGSAPMIEIAAGAEYTFGGRDGEGRRPWNVRLPRGALRSFFLDSREVNRGEFLASLARAEFAAARFWPGGRAPDAARIAALRSALDGDPAAPATSVTFDEALAYAAFHGKRLVTLPEWEFAVRGENYRDSPAEDRAPGLPLEWPANLCAAPREWSATPERLVPGALDFASQCQKELELLLAGTAVRAEAAGAAWVTGGSEAEGASWSARTLRASERGHADVGFRCALDLAQAHERLDRGDYEILE